MHLCAVWVFLGLNSSFTALGLSWRPHPQSCHNAVDSSSVMKQIKGGQSTNLISCGFSWIWVFPKIGVPQNGWCIRENPIKLDDLRGFPPIFGSTPISSWLYFSRIVPVGTAATQLLDSPGCLVACRSQFRCSLECFELQDSWQGETPCF